MDDNQAILAELDDEWVLESNDEDEAIAKEFANKAIDPNCRPTRRSAALMYLAAKRRYKQAPVKTLLSFEEWEPSTKRPESHFDMQRSLHRKEGWNAALANALIGRFEVGDVVMSRGSSDGKWMESVIMAFPKQGGPVTNDPSNVRPAPKTVDLTDDEKLQALNDKGMTLKVFVTGTRAGKTLDELCKEYGVETTRSV